MITRPCGNALEWWLKSQGKFVNGAFFIKEKSSMTEITKGVFVESATGEGIEIKTWAVPGVPKPTDAEAETIIDQYNAFLAADDSAKKAEKAIIFQKMGVSEAEFKKVSG